MSRIKYHIYREVMRPSNVITIDGIQYSSYPDYRNWHKNRSAADIAAKVSSRTMYSYREVKAVVKEMIEMKKMEELLNV
ncbi:hypothetical protein [Vibrio phage PJN101]|nr:hypothetical protein [Vibrio phage PJN101]